MNRIILIGNGFDLAHGLKTSYKNFIDDYWKNRAELLKDMDEDSFSDGNLSFYFNPGQKKYNEDSGSFINPFSSINDCTFCEIERIINSGLINLNWKNTFLKRITGRCYLNNWVDVEKEFYSTLKECFNKDNQYKIDELNRDFNNIKSLLRDYLNDISQRYIDGMLKKGEILEKILMQFRYREFSQSYKNNLIDNLIEKVNPKYQIDKEDVAYKSIIYYFKNVHKIDNEKNIERKDLEIILNDISRAPSILHELMLKNILFLNFNYTNTCTSYRNRIVSNHSPKLCVDTINIHGTLNDPDNSMIFGYGDEIDDDYKTIVDLDDNRYLDNIKSTKYHETDNYKKLLEYIDSDYFQIFIFGHSCGLSDRTLLSTLFNHHNCVSIKPFYHKILQDDGTYTDNYSDIVRNISRHFGDKASLRDKVVNKTYCEPLTGSK